MPPLTLGTAGHIDHGKTALIRALTGVDTDRLPEEQRRGMTIELGYAALGLPSGRRLSVVDVPGHERLVRTMVAGATGIDLFLLAVAADDGVMPQTREHLAVLEALGVTEGVVAITKSDLGAPPELPADHPLLRDAPVVAVSARTGAGLDDLRAALDAVAARVRPRTGGDDARLHVDRVFTIHGAGTVVTGTLWSGSLGAGDEVTLLPQGRRARIRGVQVHDVPAERAQAGQRVALNLAGVRRDEVHRGDVVATGPLAPTYRIEAELAGPFPARVMVHHGTREALARPVEIAPGRWQLRLDGPLMATAGDRVVVRALAPPDTLGGGVVLDAAPPRRRSLDEPAVDPSPEPAPAPPEPEPEPLTPEALAAEAALAATGVEPPPDGELPGGPDDLAALREAGRAVRIASNRHIHPGALAEAERVLRAVLERDGTISLAGYRDELGTSRRHAQALLEHFDSERVTLRRGDERILRRPR